jgi:hypothetical protein
MAAKPNIILIKNLIDNLSSRIDACIADINSIENVPSGKWDEHRAEINNLLEPLFEIWPPTSDKTEIGRMIEKNNEMSRGERKQLSEFLKGVKIKLVIMLNRLGCLNA